MSEHSGRFRIDFADKVAGYGELDRTLAALLAGEHDRVANLANCAALLFEHVPDLNWAGFYLLRGQDLVLGPFQGHSACARIAMGRGVCGAAAERRRSIVVPDVHAFPGHIACDSASRSEIVVPLLPVSGALFGVMDLDSPQPGRFDDLDRIGLERLATTLLASLQS